MGNPNVKAKPIVDEEIYIGKTVVDLGNKKL
jgi:hypothetical protein